MHEHVGNRKRDSELTETVISRMTNFSFHWQRLMTNTIPDSLKPFDPGFSSIRPELSSQLMAVKYITVATLAVSCSSWCLPIALIDQLDSDVHLGNFNQHRQWLQSPLRASVTLTNCYLFYIAVRLLFSVVVFPTYSSTDKGYVVLGLL